MRSTDGTYIYIDFLALIQRTKKTFFLSGAFQLEGGKKCLFLLLEIGFSDIIIDIFIQKKSFVIFIKEIQEIKNKS